MAEQVEPWWRQVDEAAQLIVSTVNAAASQAGRDGVYTPPPGTPAPRRGRRPASLRHLAEVIRAQRMAPGLAVDKDIVAGVLGGDLRHLGDPVAVVAVSRASHHIAGVPFGDDDARRLTVAVDRLNTLVAAARDADRRAPELLPAARPGAALVAEPGPAAGEPIVIDAVFTTRPPRRRLLALAAVVVLVVAGAGTYALLRGGSGGARRSGPGSRAARPARTPVAATAPRATTSSWRPPPGSTTTWPPGWTRPSTSTR